MRAGRRSLTTMMVNPANASKITAKAQNTWHRLVALAADRASCDSRARPAKGLHSSPGCLQT